MKHLVVVIYFLEGSPEVWLTSMVILKYSVLVGREDKMSSQAIFVSILSSF